VQDPGAIAGEFGALGAVFSDLGLETLAIEFGVTVIEAAQLSPRHIQFGF
jgi:predicted DNA-binding protein (UPF0278 family)